MSLASASSKADGHSTSKQYTKSDFWPLLRGRSQLSTFMYSYRAYEGEGGGHDASVLFLNVDILLMQPPGGYD